jgi:hypothetical protein
MLKFGQWKDLLIREMDGDMKPTNPFDKNLFKGGANVGAQRATQGVQNLSSNMNKAKAIVQLVLNSIAEEVEPNNKKSILALVRKKLAEIAGAKAPVNSSPMGSDVEQ